MALFLAWSILKLIHFLFLEVSRTGEKRKLSLSLFSMILNALGNAIRFAFRCIQQKPMVMNYGVVEVAKTSALIVLNALSMACWIASFAIIMGFWVHALNARLHIRFATRTKVFCIIGAFMVLLMIPGMLMATIFDQPLVGTLLIIVPFFIDSTLFVVITIVLSADCCTKRKTAAEVSEENLLKVAHVRRYFILGSASWVVVTIAGSLGGIIQPLPGMDTIFVLPQLISSIAENVVIFSTMMLVERRVGPIKLVKDIFTWKTTLPERSATQRTNSASHSSTKTTVAVSAASSTNPLTSELTTFSVTVTNMEAGSSVATSEES